MSAICYENNGNKYRIFTVARCICDNSTFYKTYEQQKEDIKRANIRIASLDKVAHIADNYYKGRYPWLEVGDSHGC